MKSAKVLLCILISLSAKKSFSQDIIFYNQRGGEVDSLDCAYYSIPMSGKEARLMNSGFLTSTAIAFKYLYKIEAPLSNDTSYSFYCKTNILRSKELRTKFGMREGMCFYFHPNGQLKEKILFRDGLESGLSTELFWSGRAKITRMYLSKDQIQNKTPFRYLIVNSWDSLGNQQVKNRNGYFKDRFEEGKVKDGLRDSTWVTNDPKGKIYEEFRMGEFVAGKRDIEGKTIQYTEYEVAASPVGGLPSVYRFIGEKLRYPAKARRMGAEGKVFVEFVINRDGSIDNVKVMRGVEKTIDQEAVRVVRLLEKWNPAYFRGLLVRQKFVLPINFKLG